jgi:hypothetical protein
MRVRLAVVSVFVFLLVSLVHGAMQSPVLSGVVTDNQGSLIPGVTVTITAAVASTPVLTTTTGEDGRFRVMTLKPGAYVVTFDLAGFMTQRRTITIKKAGGLSCSR